jgi:hypothetical protein
MLVNMATINPKLIRAAMSTMVKMDAGTKANVVSAVSAFGKFPGSTPVNVLRYKRANTYASPPVAVTSAPYT